MKITGKNAGMTLIEVMVAMFLLAFIVAAVYSSWTAIIRGSKAGLTAAADVQRQRTALEALEISLMSARMFVADAQYYSFEAENGSKAYLSFVAHLPASFVNSGKFGQASVRRVTFSIEQGRVSGNDLVLRQAPMLLEMDQDEKEFPLVLARNVKKFEMEFYDIRNREWVDEWTMTNQLPQKVKINLQVGSMDQDRDRDEINRIIYLPATAVPSIWQGRRGQGNQPP